MGLEILIKENSYPIVFIGSGISKRYLTKSPSWIELLEDFWNLSNIKEDFYGNLNDIRNDFIKQGNSEILASFNANIKIASIIEESFNQQFNKAEIKMDGLTTKEAYQKNISPFKFAISESFKNYSLNLEIKEEFESWKSFIRKAQIIITTNYDTLIEDSYSSNNNGSLKRYIGQEGFFDNTSGSAELFKIHGCCTNPDSIVINSSDYERFDKNSILISAKILSSLITSPIIFLGYSLSDANVRKIISDFTSQLPREDSRISANRIIIVERKTGIIELNQSIIQDSEIGSYTLIQTDNYKAIYDKISSINQGLTPYEIRRYQDVLKKLIISHGAKGTLDAVLLSPKDLNSIEKDIDMNKPIVVAFGDKKYMYVMPDFISYMDDYVLEKDDIPLSVALEYIAHSQSTARFPFKRLLDRVVNVNELGLSENTLKKLRNKISKCDSYSGILSTINKNSMIKENNIEDIWSKDFALSKKIEVLIFNLKDIYETNNDELKQFLKFEILELLKESYKSNAGNEHKNARSSIRKLYYYYDILKYGEIEEI